MVHECLDLSQKDARIATALLRGASMLDVVEINGLSEEQCRDALHNFCRATNREFYDDLCRDVAYLGVNLPSVSLLVRERWEFLPRKRVGGTDPHPSLRPQRVAYADERELRNKLIELKRRAGL